MSLPSKVHVKCGKKKWIKGSSELFPVQWCKCGQKLPSAVTNNRKNGGVVFYHHIRKLQAIFSAVMQVKYRQNRIVTVDDFIRHYICNNALSTWNFQSFNLKTTAGDNCRSTSAKPVDKRSPQQRTPQVHLAEVRDSSDTSNLYANS